MEIALTEEEAARLIGYGEDILRIISYAQGRAASYLARRDEIKVLEFPGTREGSPSEQQNRHAEITEKEIQHMPKEFQKFFKYGGKRRRIRRKENGVYEVRACIFGRKISASSIKRDEAVRKFTEKLREISSVQAKPQINLILFGDFAKQWLDTTNLSIKENSGEDNERTLRLYLLPALAEKKMNEISPLELRKLIGIQIDKGHIRTALKVYTVLNAILESALTEKLIDLNPMRTIPKPNYIPDEVQPLTRSEEDFLLETLFREEHPCRYAVVFFLYTGMRRCELITATTDGTWITIDCAKSRKGVVKQRKIPINPMLRPYMKFFTKENLTFKNDRLSRVLSKILPEHTLHHLRHTFITRAQECGIPQALVGKWVGHTPNKRNMTQSVYTHFSEEFQLEMAEKFNY